MTRYTIPKPKPKFDHIEELRKQWQQVDPFTPDLDKQGRTLAIAARLDYARFRQACHEIFEKMATERRIHGS